MTRLLFFRLLNAILAFSRKLAYLEIQEFELTPAKIYVSKSGILHFKFFIIFWSYVLLGFIIVAHFVQKLSSECPLSSPKTPDLNRVKGIKIYINSHGEEFSEENMFVLLIQ